ncbi:glycerol-3-phosphate acyltransferase 2 [Clostridia bacterium]|nr:glycerol-3-phosphate acyltransferase 2 [Clostridia bacterium]
MIRMICLAIGYSLGMVQSAYLYGRIKNIDIREHGSKNAGATNALRILGKKAGVTVFVIDVLKAVLAIFLVRLLFGVGYRNILPVLILYTGLGTVLGHNYPFYLGFKGGKGIAVTMGVVLSLSLRHTPAILAFLICLALSRYVSLSSLVMVVVFFIQAVFFTLTQTYFIRGIFPKAEFLLLALALAALPFYTHRSNIVRLKAGTEHKMGEKKESEITVEL